MKPVSQEEYTRMQAEDWEWAKALIQCQIDDKRPGVQHLTNRPVINIKQMLQSSAELYGAGIAFYTKFEKGPYKTITHLEVFDDVNAMGTALIANGMKDRRIAVIGETTYMWGIGYLGTVCGTGIVVPLDKELPYDELRNLIIEAECSAVIFDEKREDTFVRMMQETVSVGADRRGKEADRRRRQIVPRCADRQPGDEHNHIHVGNDRNGEGNNAFAQEHRR